MKFIRKITGNMISSDGVDRPQKTVINLCKQSWLFLLGAGIALAMYIAGQLQMSLPGNERLFANIFFVLMFIFLAALLIASLKETIKAIKFTTRQWLISLACVTVAVCAVGAFLYWFLAQEQTIKVWDSCVYWVKFITEMNGFYNDIPSSLQTLARTFSGEYSDLAAVPLAPFGVYLGTWFYRYAFFVYILYYVPTCIMLGLYAARLYAKIALRTIKPWHIIVATVICLTCVPLLHPVILGYVDVIGTMIMTLLLHIALDWDWGKFSLGKNLLLALLSLALLLSRRWYAFYIVGFYFSFGVEFVLQAIASKKIDVKRLCKLFLNLVFIAAVCLAFILVLSPNMLNMLFGVNYGKAYTAYKTRTDFGDLIYLFKDFGWLFILLSLVGFGIMLFKQNTRAAALRALVAAGVAFILFERIQSMGVHHRYLIIPAILLGICVAVMYIGERLKSFGEVLAVAGALSLCIWNMAVAYVPTFAHVTVGTGTLFTQVKETPVIRTDLEEIRSTLKFINKETEKNNAKAYVVGNSTTISQEVFKRAFMPQIIDAATNIIPGNNIDLRDGFPSSAFFADYVLVAVPMQIACVEGREVIAQLYELFEENKETDKYYKLINSIQSDKVTFNIYQKTAPITKAYVDEIKATLRESYPDDSIVYEPNYFLALLGIDAKTPFEFYSWEQSAYLMPIKENEMCWQLNGEFTEISFDVDNWNVGLTCTVIEDGKEVASQNIEAEGISRVKFDVTGAQKLQILFECEGEDFGNIGIKNGKLM